jgi:hypothetical protein
MADDRTEPRETNWAQLLPWTALFQGFRVALDVNKLLLAAGGILTMALGWWLLAVIFSSSTPPQWSDWKKEGELQANWADFKRERDKWNLMHAAAGSRPLPKDAADVADSVDEFERIELSQKTVLKDEEKERLDRSPVSPAKLAELKEIKPYGKLRTWPFFEDRGPNPYLLVTGQAGKPNPDGTRRRVPWSAGHFGEWLTTEQAPVLLEPLFKFLEPIVFFLNPKAGALMHFYLILVMAVTVGTWALFGGAITRIAVVQVARREKIGIREAVRFAAQRYLSYFSAPFFPLIFAAVLVAIMVLFGFLHLIPGVGELLDGLFWWLLMLFALVMVVIFVGLVGWPMMSATISAEGTDSWEAVSRSYSYVYQAPWHYIWYMIVALLYGAVVVFFVGFMGSFTVYLAKWGLSQTPGTTHWSREPAYLCVYAPTSFGWRELLLKDVSVGGLSLVDEQGINAAAYDNLVSQRGWLNFGAVLVAVWLYLAFLLIVGFGYSYFWSSGCIIYLLMRKKVDDAEMDEVYLEEDEEEIPAPPGPVSGTPPPAGNNLQMVEAPALRVPSAGNSPPTEPAAPAS